MTRKPYPTDISDVEWDLIKPMIPAERKRKRGKKREVDMREVVNAIFYILRAGCSWRMMPHAETTMANSIFIFSTLGTFWGMAKNS
jgi:putative transposase